MPRGRHLHWLYFVTSVIQLCIEQGVLVPWSCAGQEIDAGHYDDYEWLPSERSGLLNAGELPQLVTLTVAEAAPHMRGESASSQQKRAIMENGAQVLCSQNLTLGSSQHSARLYL